jgi:hypothetical protein
MLAKTEEYKLQRLFTQLRSGMFPQELEKWLVAAYLMGELEALEARNFAEPIERVVAGKMNKSIAADINLDLQQGRSKSSEELQAEFQNLQAAFRAKEPWPFTSKIAADIVSVYNKVMGPVIKPTREEKRSFTLKILEAQVRLKGIEKSIFEQGHIYYLQQAKNDLQAAMQKTFYSFSDVISAYLKWYKDENPDVKTYDSEVIPQCKLLAELLGAQTGIEKINTPETVSGLKTKLRKYPRNKVKIFGDKPVSAIIGSGVSYQPLSLKTADKYFIRLYSILEFCRKRKYIMGQNEAQGERVSTKKERSSVLPEDQRKAYDRHDIEKLVEALCTKPLAFGKSNRNERFWIILISFLHSIRTGNIVGLTKGHLKSVDGIWCIDLGEYASKEVKTADTRLVFTPVHPILIELGLMEWVSTLNGERLFYDSVGSLSRWYNRNEIDARTGKVAQGFEARYVTTDPKKCLYSSRHLFGTAGNEAGVDFKVIKEMMGHAPDDRDQTRSRYAKRTSPQGQMKAQLAMSQYFEGIGFDVVRLKARAKELFNLP